MGYLAKTDHLWQDQSIAGCNAFIPGATHSRWFSRLRCKAMSRDETMKRFVQGFSCCLGLVLLGYVATSGHVMLLWPWEVTAIRTARKCENPLIVVIGHRPDLPNISQQTSSSGVMTV